MIIKKILILTASMLCSANLFGEGILGKLDLVNNTGGTVLVDVSTFSGLQNLKIAPAQTKTVDNGLFLTSRDCWIQWRYRTAELKSPGQVTIKPNGKYSAIQWNPLRTVSGDLQANQ